MIDRTIVTENTPEENGDADVEPDCRRRSHAGIGTARSVAGGRSRDARALGRVVDTWLHLAHKEARRAQLLNVPGVDTNNYMTVFKKISAWNTTIPVLTPRIFYAELRWREEQIKDGDLLTITLQPQQPYPRPDTPILCSLTIDRTGWPSGRRNALQRELKWAYDRAKAMWEEKTKSAVHVFAIAQQHADDPNKFGITDPRLIYLTDRTITQ